MERYYRVLLLITLIGLAIGLAGLLLDERLFAFVGCLVIPPAAYLAALLIDMFRRLRK